MLKRALLGTVWVMTVNIMWALPFVACVDADLGNHSVVFSVVDESGFTLPATEFVRAGECVAAEVLGAQGNFRVQAQKALLNFSSESRIYCSMNVYKNNEGYPSYPVVVIFDIQHSGFVMGPCINS